VGCLDSWEVTEGGRYNLVVIGLSLANDHAQGRGKAFVAEVFFAGELLDGEGFFLGEVVQALDVGNLHGGELLCVM